MCCGHWDSGTGSRTWSGIAATTERSSSARSARVLPGLAGYAETVAAVAASRFVLTDSGGLQEEAPTLGKPVLVMRRETERPEGLEAGTLRLVGAGYEDVVRETRRLLTDGELYGRMARASNPYGDGKAAERIVASLLHVLRGGPAPVEFQAPA